MMSINTIKDLKIAVVDDENPSIINSVKEIMPYNTDITEYNSGDDFLKDTNLGSFDVAIIDQIMPGFSGLETVKRMKENHDHIVSIMLTAYGDLNLGFNAKSKGFDFVLEKPLDDSVFLQLLNNAITLVNERRINQDLTNKIKSLENAVQSQAIENVEQIFTGLYGINDIVKEINNRIWTLPLFKTGDQFPLSYFPTTLYLYGPPGCGKTELLNRICDSYGSRNELSHKATSVGIHTSDWEKPLKDEINNIYKKVLIKNDIQFILFEDRAITDASKMGETSGDWQNLLHRIRNFIKSATAINNREKPNDSDLLEFKNKNGTDIKGKIIWLFALNEEVDTGSKFAPFMDVLGNGINVYFPEDEKSRMEIFKNICNNEDINIENNLLQWIVQDTLWITNGRKLVGDKKFSTNGIIQEIINEANRNYYNGESSTKVITDEIIQSILNDYNTSGSIAEKNNHKVKKKLTSKMQVNLDKYELSLKIYQILNRKVVLIKEDQDKEILEMMTRYCKCTLEDNNVFSNDGDSVSKDDVNKLEGIRKKLFLDIPPKRVSEVTDSSFYRKFGIATSNPKQDDFAAKNGFSKDFELNHDDYKDKWPLLRQHWNLMK